jgi:hypothetical protein
LRSCNLLHGACFSPMILSPIRDFYFWASSASSPILIFIYKLYIQHSMFFLMNIYEKKKIFFFKCCRYLLFFPVNHIMIF